MGCLAWAGSALAQSDETLFPRPESLEPAVAFWTRVYTEADTQSGYVHDNRHLEIVYEMLRFPGDPGSRQRRRITNRALDKYRDILSKLGRGEREDLSAEEQEVLTLWPEGTTNEEFAAAAKRVRFQLGQSDRFRAGLIRSGYWKPHIEGVLAERGLPLELAALPHVESSFDPGAYSRVGAAGMWQFTRSTGLRYMQIDHIIDERRDPFISTYAAARLLADNHDVIQSWPLAVTAYNHGLAGMRRAVDRLGTRDIGVIVERYNGRTFGFASRNFYAAFLAALAIDSDPEQYFGEIEIATPNRNALIEMPDFMDADTVAEALGVSRSELERWNPALMETVWEGDKLIPKGFVLRLLASDAIAASERLAAVPAGARYAAQRPDLYHRVSSGDTLSEIADRYNVSLASLVRINGLRSRNFIRIGQMLTLPVSGPQNLPTLAEPAPAVADDGSYIVRRGDSIDRIARRLGVSAPALLAANGLRAEALIFPGQSLSVPGAGAGEAEAADSGTADEEPAVVAAVEAEEAASEPLAEVDEPAIVAAADIDAPDTLAAPGLVIAVSDAEQAAVAGASETADEDNALSADQAVLAADPSDYSVAADGSIEVQAMETLGHYADWLGVRTQRLRDLNAMAFNRAVVMGERIELDFSVTDVATFERRRTAYQQERQESFFSSYQIETITDHVVRPGESLWVLAQRTYNVPVWLLRQYNPDLDLDRVSPGMVIKFPNLRRIT